MSWRAGQSEVRSCKATSAGQGSDNGDGVVESSTSVKTVKYMNTCTLIGQNSGTCRKALEGTCRVYCGLHQHEHSRCDSIEYGQARNLDRVASRARKV